MDLLLLQGRGFSFGLYLRVRVPLGACDVIRGTTNTIMRRVRGMVVTRGGVMARLLDGARKIQRVFC